MYFDQILEAIPLTSGMRQGFPLSPFPFSIGGKVLSGAIRQEREFKVKQIGKD